MILDQETWLGPLPGWELVRLARRGQVTRARFLVLSILLVAFILAPIFWFTRYDAAQLFFDANLSLSISEIASFGDRLATVMVLALVFSVAVIAPGYAAAAVAEEKDRQTWPLLLSSGLSNREIIVGKIASRFVFMAMAILSSVPVLIATTVFGGASIEFILSGAFLVTATTFLAVAIGVHAGCIMPSLRAALLRAYPLVATAITLTSIGIPCCGLSPFACCWSLFAVIDLPWPMLGSAFVLGVVQLLIAAKFIRRAMLTIPAEMGERQLQFPVIRSNPFEDHDAPFVVEEQLASQVRSTKVQAQALAQFRAKPPLLNADPILWKERFVGRTMFPEFLILANFLPAAGAFVIYFGSMSYHPWQRLWLMIVMYTISSCVFVCQAAVGFAAAIARERQKQTLDALRLLPMASERLLSIKVAAVLERYWGWIVASLLTGVAGASAIGTAWAVGLATYTFSILGVMIGLGSWLSVTSSTELKALRGILPVALTLVSVPIILVSFVAPVDLQHYAKWLFVATVMLMIAGAVYWHRAKTEFVGLN